MTPYEKKKAYVKQYEEVFNKIYDALDNAPPDFDDKTMDSTLDDLERRLRSLWYEISNKLNDSRHLWDEEYK